MAKVNEGSGRRTGHFLIEVEESGESSNAEDGADKEDVADKGGYKEEVGAAGRIAGQASQAWMYFRKALRYQDLMAKNLTAALLATKSFCFESTLGISHYNSLIHEAHWSPSCLDYDYFSEEVPFWNTF